MCLVFPSKKEGKRCCLHLGLLQGCFGYFLDSHLAIEKLKGKNDLSWAVVVELWFLGQGYHDHLEKEEVEGSIEVKLNGRSLMFSYVPCYGNL